MVNIAAWIFLPALTVAGTSMVSSQEYPYKPVRIVVSAPGGAGDFAVRLIAPAISGPLGQQVIVDNRGGVLPGEIVARALPDGYTLLHDAGSFWVSPILQEMRYDPVRDFAPITLTTSSPNLFVVHPSIKVNSVKELIALAKSKPGVLNYGSASAGSTPHLNAELFKSMAGVDIVQIAYKGAGPAVVALVANEVQLMIGTASSLAPYVKSGRLKALAVTTAQPSALFPGVPTMASSGVPGYEVASTNGIFAPAKTPTAIITRLHGEIVRALARPDVKESFLNAGVETVGSTTEEFAAAIKKDIAKWGKLIKEAGIKVN